MEKEAGIDAAAESFRIADVVRSRAVQGALAASSARAAAGNKDLANLVRREQDAQKQVSALFALLVQILSVPTDQQDQNAVKTLRTQIAALRTARTAITREIEKRFPEYSDLINPKPATIGKVQKALAAGEALVATYVSENRTFVWAVPKQGKAAFKSAPLGKRAIAAAVKDLRKALDPKAASLGDIPDFDVALSNRLYRALLAPVRSGWANADSLMIVAHRALGQLPFSVLVTKKVSLAKDESVLFAKFRKIPWLARTHAVTVLPSVTSLTSLRALPPASSSRRAFIGFGDPYFNTEQQAEAAQATPVQVAALTTRGAFKARGIPLSLRAAPKTAGIPSANIEILPSLFDTFEEVHSIARAPRRCRQGRVYRRPRQRRRHQETRSQPL